MFIVTNIYSISLINIYENKPGKFRTTDYNLAEFNKILTNSFLKWIGSNKIDYAANKYFDSNDKKLINDFTDI